MNYKFLSLIAAMLLGCGCAMAQNYEDDIYYDGSSEPSTTKVKVTRQSTMPNTYYGEMSTTVTPINGVVNGRDIDEYNRRTDRYYAEDDTVYLEDEAFANTRRIERYHNPEIVIRSNDPDLIEYYFDNTPSVNLIVGTTWGWGPSWGWGWRSAYYDPWYSWGWGWYSPWYYSSWYDWGWYGGYRYHPWSYWGRPWGGWYGWHNGWHSGWYNGGYAHGGHYQGGVRGRRPGLNYHGDRGNSGHGYASAPGRGINGRSVNRGNRPMNHGNIGTASTNYGGNTGRTSTMRPGGRTAHGNLGGNTYGGSSSTGRVYSTPSTPTRSISGGSRSGGYTGGSRSSGGYTGGSRSSGGFSGGSHGGGGGFSGGGSRGGGGGSHGGGGGSHGGRR